jgi:hypothetical protein
VDAVAEVGGLLADVPMDGLEFLGQRSFGRR